MPAACPSRCAITHRRRGVQLEGAKKLVLIKWHSENSPACSCGRFNVCVDCHNDEARTHGVARCVLAGFTVVGLTDERVDTNRKEQQ